MKVALSLSLLWAPAGINSFLSLDGSTLSIFKPILHVQCTTIANILAILCINGFPALEEKSIIETQKIYFGKKLALVAPRLGFQRRAFDFINMLSIHCLHIVTNLTFYCQVFKTSGSKYTYCGQITITPL